VQRRRRQRHRIGGQHPHLVFVHLEHVETPAPFADVRDGTQRPQAVGLHRPRQHVQVGVHRTRERLADEHRRLEVELPPAQEIDVQRVEPRRFEHRLEPEPRPRRHSAAHHLAPPLVVEVAQLHAVVGIGHDDRAPVRRHPAEPAHELRRRRREILSDLDDRNDLPVLRQRGVHPAERVADPAPFLDRGRARVAAIDHVPNDRTDDADAALARHDASPA
jgi:hypothetical protein